jgi:hypothetical protein
VVTVSSGKYLGECSDTGNPVTIPSAVIKKLGAATVVIDCEGTGRVFNVESHDKLFMFRLEGLTIANGKSMKGGAAYVEGGHVILKDCIFDNLESTAGGGAIMFTVRNPPPPPAPPLLLPPTPFWAF